MRNPGFAESAKSPQRGRRWKFCRMRVKFRTVGAESELDVRKQGNDVLWQLEPTRLPSVQSGPPLTFNAYFLISNGTCHILRATECQLNDQHRRHPEKNRARQRQRPVRGQRSGRGQLQLHQQNPSRQLQQKRRRYLLRSLKRCQPRNLRQSRPPNQK